MNRTARTLFHQTLSVTAPALALLVSAAAPGAEPLFDTWLGYSAGEFHAAAAYYPVAQAIADLDGDGDLDAAFAHQGKFAGPRVSVILNNGGGAFTQPAYYAVPLEQHDIIAADLSGDGRPDLLTCNSNSIGSGSGASYLRNLGNGTFAPAVAIATAPGPTSAAAFDLEGDGDLDLAICQYDAGQGTTVAIKLNNGSGSFAPGPTLGAGTAPKGIAAADVDDNGLADLIVVNDSNFFDGKLVRVFLNSGGTFGAPAAYSVGGYPEGDGKRPAVADIDQDGDLDIVVSTSQLAVLRNEGDGTFAAAQSYPVLIAPTWNVALADVTGDGRLDALTAGGQMWSVLPGDGQGGFLSFSAGTINAGGDWPRDVDAGDIDGDGDLDVLVANMYSISFNVHFNPGDGDFSPVPLYPITNLTFTLDRGDIDGDGDLDVVTGGNLSPLNFNVLHNDGDGTFAPPISWGAGVTASQLRLRDLDGDGLADLLWIPRMEQPPYHFFTALANGSGTFGPSQTWPINTCGNNDLDAFDLDNDGDLDVVVSEGGGGCPGIPGSGRRLFPARNNGSGSFTLLPPLVLDGGPHCVAAGDFNGDGILDLTTGYERVLGLGNMAYGPPAVTGSAIWYAAVGDVNGDGMADLAGADNGQALPESFRVVLGNGDGTFQAEQSQPASYSPTLAAVTGAALGDMDGDGDLDGLVANGASRDVSYFENAGGGAFLPQIRYGMSGDSSGGSGPNEIVVDDFNGDGSLDVVASTYDTAPFSNSVGVLLNRISQVTGDVTGDGLVNVADLLALLGAWGPCPPVSCPADLDGDGDVGILDLLLLLANWS